MKQHIIPALAIGISIIVASASCSKKTVAPQARDLAHLTPDGIFSLKRKGEIASIDIKVDLPPCKAVEILRNSTGIASERILVARLKSNIRTFDDILPDAKAQWYWIKVFPLDGESLFFGPVRVDPDVDNSGKYGDITHRFPWSLKRTNSSASISWDFPSSEVSVVVIRRNTNQKLRNRTEVYRTQEWNGSHADAFPDPEADYWYWIDAIQNSGRVISQGPIKAEFAGY